MSLSFVTANEIMVEWWAWEDLNFRPHAYQARALTKLSYRPGDQKPKSGGAERNRTDDLLLAKQALSQLSYSPVLSRIVAPRAIMRDKRAVSRWLWKGCVDGGIPIVRVRMYRS